MRETGKKYLLLGLGLTAAFALLTWLLQVVDVKPLGVDGTDIGFSAWNCWFHRLWGVHLTLYVVTDWAGLVPIIAAASFGVLGLAQLIRRRSLWKVDADILILGGYYLVLIFLYLLFEMVPINYRPILINGAREASYPSSTTLLVLGVMLTLTEQLSRRCRSGRIRTVAAISTWSFSAFMVVGRLISGVHWLTDILGAAILSAGLFCMYRGLVFLALKNHDRRG